MINLPNGDGPTVLLRADMDGLPVVEQTGLPYASTQTATPASGVTTGVMHACGHDTHMAGFIGAARLLVDHKDQWQGTLVMVLQPAEEIGLGALAMLDDGLYTKFPKPDYALAFHDAAAPAPAAGGSAPFTFGASSPAPPAPAPAPAGGPAFTFGAAPPVRPGAPRMRARLGC